jgi:EAL domain-containing protein (putative c-di-GMP-specific phosphodiesterase class I)
MSKGSIRGSHCWRRAPPPARAQRAARLPLDELEIDRGFVSGIVGDDEAQGSHLSRPLPAAALVEWLRDRRPAATQPA